MKVLDFGLAKAVEHSGGWTATWQSDPTATLRVVLNWTAASRTLQR